jgi:hypothetical protein
LQNPFSFFLRFLSPKKRRIRHQISNPKLKFRIPNAVVHLVLYANVAMVAQGLVLLYRWSNDLYLLYIVAVIFQILGGFHFPIGKELCQSSSDKKRNGLFASILGGSILREFNRDGKPTKFTKYRLISK